MTSYPDQLRQDIESTRGELRSDVATLTDKVSPQRIVRRRVNRVRGAWHSLRDKVMGTAYEVGEAGRSTASSAAHQASSAAHQASSAAHRVSSTASAVGDMASSARQMPRERVQGSPLAAGLIAFGVGVLASSFVPSSQREQRAAGRVMDEAAERTGAFKQQVTESAQHVAKDMGRPARQAVMESGKSAAHGASAVMDQTQSAAHEVREQAREAKENVKRH